MFETLGHYKILDRIGAGGMGEVYRARDTRLGRTVAIKVLVADVAGDADRRERFLRDARATAALSHPNIAALYEIGEDQDQLFLVFEYVPGETLKNVVGGRPLNPRRAIDLAIQIADALADAHAEGIVHRDIKPDNIIVTPKGNAKILDFGLATWTAGGAGRDRAARTATMMATAAGTTPGTVAYLSPEQALGERVDHRTDIFSLGIVLFEMLTGKLPFNGTTSDALALQIVQAPAPVPSSVNKALPAEIDPIVGRAMAKSLEQRYESAVTLAAELRSVGAILDVRSDTQEAASVSVQTRPARRSGAGWIVLLIVLAALAAAAWYERGPIQRIWRRTLGSAPSPAVGGIPLAPAEGPLLRDILRGPSGQEFTGGPTSPRRTKACHTLLGPTVRLTHCWIQIVHSGSLSELMTCGLTNDSGRTTNVEIGEGACAGRVCREGRWSCSRTAPG